MNEPKPVTGKTTAAMNATAMARLLKLGRADAADEHPPQTNVPLTSVAGPSAVTLQLKPPGPLTVGRAAARDLPLEGSDYVSRNHGRFEFDQTIDGGTWFYIDQNSRHGSYLNGVKLTGERRYPLAVGDCLELRPWAFIVDKQRADANAPHPIVQTVMQSPSESAIRPVQLAPDHVFRLRQLDLLLSGSERFGQAERVEQIAEVVVETTGDGTGFANIAFLGPLEADGSVKVIAQRGAALMPDGTPRLSRSLIENASAGKPVCLSRQTEQAVTAQSVVDLGITEAVCVPLLIGQTVSGYLYLDHRESDGKPGAAAAGAAEFAVSVGRLAALAWSNLRRQDMQLRYERINADLSAAAVAQRWVLPAGEQQCGPVRCVGENRPGRGLSGDFFDIVPLDDRRVAVVLGDVCGKGVAASIWTTAAQGYIRAALQAGRSLTQVVAGLSQYMQDRSEGALFMTLWVGVIDNESRTLEYVDAGHGYGFLLSGQPPHVQLKRLADAGGPLVGIEMEDAQYETATVELVDGDRVLVVSDGIVEQTAPAAEGEDQHAQFDLEGVLRAVARVKRVGDELKAIFRAVNKHAGGKPLNDDATAVLVWVAPAQAS